MKVEENTLRSTQSTKYDVLYLDLAKRESASRND